MTTMRAVVQVDAEAAAELLSRTCDIGGGTRVTNCVQHMNRELTNRPTDCPLCASDVQNQLSRAIAINGWLNQWKDDADRLLRRRAEA